MAEKLDLESKDLIAEKLEQLQSLFPNLVTEGENGKVLDLDQLKNEFSTEVVEGTKERYRLEWPGKKEAIVTANLPTTKTLRPVKEDSVDWDTTENLYIEGDNLEVLKILQESYFGKIKMIYIDPPYNTGKDFVYKDNFSKDARAEVEESGQKNELNQRLFQNADTSGRYHSDWLSMMYPRLKLARNLLSKDGAIFISIDDNEAHNMKKVCDEIFGQDNFLANIVWQKKYSVSNDDPNIGAMHDHILVYRKSPEFKRNLLPRTEKQLSRYKNLDDDPRGVWTSGEYVSSKSKEERPTLWYPIKHPKTGEEIWPDENAVWRYSQNKHLELEAEGRLYWGKDYSYRKPRLKRFLDEIQDGVVPATWWNNSEYGNNDEASKETAKLIGKKVFSTPKPVKLISTMLQISANEDDVILDFFAGSAATAHAVMELNADRGGRRKHIMVQLPEICDDKSEAYKAGYKNICEIGKERIRRAGAKIKEETGADIDYGFRVYRLDDSNMADVYHTPQDYDQDKLELFADNVKEDRTADDLLAQIMLDWGLPLSLPIKEATIAGKRVFHVAGNSLLACFDTEIDEDFAKEIAKEEPLRIVFKDAGFASDTAKSNVKQLLKQLSPETEMKVI